VRHKKQKDGVKFSHLNHYHEYRLNRRRKLPRNALGHEELHYIIDESWDMTEEKDKDNTNKNARMGDLILG
jgi:hypothetical protein